MKIAVLPGDGVGPEIIASSVSVLNAVSNDIEIITADIGLGAFKRTGDHMPRETLDAIDESDAVLLGTVIEPDDKAYRSPLAALKKQLDLYASVRPVRRIAGDIGIADADMVIIKDNLEGIGSASESEDRDGVTQERRVSIKNCKRICKVARTIGETRSHVTCVHKADVLKASDGLFRDIFREEMSGTSLKTDDMLLGKAVADIIRSPGSMDVIVTLNLYGDVLTEAAAAMAGGSHLVPSGSIGDSKGLFEPMHGPEPELTGLNEVDPAASILSAAMMLDFLGMKDESRIVYDAVVSVIKSGHRTKDIGGTCGTYEFAEKVAGACRQSLQGMK